MSAIDGSRTRTGVKRRSSAGSFSMCWRYSSCVVAPMQGNSPRASAAFSSFAASCGPSPVEPAPMIVWISSMKTTTRARGAPDLLLDAEELLGEGAAELRARRRRSPCRSRRRPASRAAPCEEPLRDPLDDGGLADARLADEERVVRAPLPEDVDRLLDLALAPDERVELPGRGELGQVPAELREPGELLRIERVRRAARLAPRRRSRGRRPAAAVEVGAGAAARARRAAARAERGRGAAVDPAAALELLHRLLELRVEGAERLRGVAAASALAGAAARGGRRGGSRCAGRPDPHRLQLPEPPRHARGEVGEGDVPERRELQPAGGEELVREARADAAHRDEEVQAVHLLGADRLRHLARALAQVALDAARAPSASAVIAARIRSSSTPRSFSRISARFGTVKNARSWWALVSFWLTLAAMSAASARTCASSIDSMTWGMFRDDPISEVSGQFFD